jgi:hypothetical protein
MATNNIYSLSRSQKTTNPSDMFRNTINNLTKYIKPQKAFTEVANYDTFAQPFRQLGQEFVNTNLTPEFNQNTFNPFKQNLSNNLAASNAGMMGNAQGLVQNQIRQVRQPFEDQLEQVRQQFESLGNQNYQSELRKYYNSPTAFTNF